MKLSIIITAIILIVATGFGWYHHPELVNLRAGNAKLAEEVAKHVISRNGASGARHREREDVEALAADFIAFTSEVGKQLEKGVGPDAETAKRTGDFIDRIMTLNASQMESIFAQFRAAPGINEFARRHMLMDCVVALSTRNPRAGLELFINSPELLDEGSNTKQYIGEFLGKLAKVDPQSALEWIRSRKESHPDLVSNDAISFVAAAVAASDPTHAFQLLGDMEESKYA